MKIINSIVKGENATVNCALVYKDGSTANRSIPLSKEGDIWKLGLIPSEPKASLNSPPNNTAESAQMQSKEEESIRSSHLHSGDDFLGNWRGRHGVEAWISKDGDNYLVTYHHFGKVYKFMGRYEGGQMNLSNSMFGDMSYSKQSGKIYWKGDEFTKIGN